MSTVMFKTRDYSQFHVFLHEHARERDRKSISLHCLCSYYGYEIITEGIKPRGQLRVITCFQVFDLLMKPVYLRQEFRIFFRTHHFPKYCNKYKYFFLPVCQGTHKWNL